MLLVMLPVIPLAGALCVLLKRGRGINIPLLISAIVLILGVCGLSSVLGGTPIDYEIPLPGPYAPAFHADSLSLLFVLLAAFLWVVVSIYTPEYMKHEGGSRRFEFCALLILSTVLGIFLAGNLITLLLFFELMTITSFFWVVHRWNQEAIKAGYYYLFFNIIGGLLLGLGIVLLDAAAGVLPDIGTGIVTPVNAAMFGWSIMLFVVGFGIKAGMVPLHLWLPHAHSAAPAPGSALLSGLLIKVGAYGLIRVGEFAGWGGGFSNGVTWLGPALAILGTVTMLVGVIAALLQSDAKRLLAYHSVSQMGYIILGVGIGLYLGSDGSLGLVGAIYHIINHALFKAALFLGVGVIYIYTKETNLYKLGGLWRRFPVIAFLMLLAVLGITGVPGMNGYASKTLLHHAVSLAAGTGTLWSVWAERLFLVVGVGTAASFAKLYYLVFLGKPAKIEIAPNISSRLEAAPKAAMSVKLRAGMSAVRPLVAMSVLAAAMVGIGIVPGFFPNAIALPAVQALGMENAAASLDGLSFWNAGDLTGIFITLILGILVCWAGLRSGVFHWHPPKWLTLEGLGMLTGRAVSVLLRTAEKFYRTVVKAVRNVLKNSGARIYLACQKVDHARSGMIFGLKLAGVSIDAAILFILLALLIAWHVMLNPGLTALF